MSGQTDQSIIDIFIYESNQMIENLEQLIIESEMNETFTEESINEIFRIMHSIKGSAAMMMYTDISHLAHIIEDVFFVIRKQESLTYDFSKLTDIILESVDFFKIELMKVKNGEEPDGDSKSLTKGVQNFLDKMNKDNKLDNPGKEIILEKPEEKEQKYYISPSKTSSDLSFYKVFIKFKEKSEMENIRAYTVVHNMKELIQEAVHIPADLINDDESEKIIQANGFSMVVSTKKPFDQIDTYLKSTVFLEKLELEEIDEHAFKDFTSDNKVEESEEIKIPKSSKKYQEKKTSVPKTTTASKTTMISVNVEKLDQLMDMVGELVIAEAMTTQNPEVLACEIESFDKASRQLHKITAEMQDMVMAIRMVPLSTTFMKMHRIVRDMNKNLDKSVVLEVIGEETEVDKNIIEKISDPLMHIIRNSIDHGIEAREDRVENNKDEHGKVILEAKNSGSDVLVIIKDDGKGLDKDRIYEKAIRQGVIDDPIDTLDDKDIFNLILKPGFSTNEEVTEYSGRGVGMDVVAKNIQGIGGSVIVDSALNVGTTITLKIPLTLAIIEGMNIKVGDTRFTIPIVAIQESFRPKNSDVFKDTNDNEMIMVRGNCYPIIRLHEFYEVPTDIHEYESGILIMVEENDKSYCLFADELLGQQQVVIKTLPDYIKKYKKIKGLSGCTLLGDGSISLILDIGDMN